MKELVFSISDIFNNETPDGCLSQYGASSFHIPAYQRGYKWDSGPDGAVSVLLDDLWSAFENQEDEYYLQYITVKPLNLHSDCYLEVIDGQQRLTTLSILLSVLNLLQADKTDSNNIALNKLDYAIRENFFDDYIYQKEMLEQVSESDWDTFIVENPEKLDRQDIFYLHGAIRECTKFFNNKTNSLSDFQSYLLRFVKLIVNSVEPHIISETVFKNLNSNKVPLSETELIKALFITKVGRNNVKHADSHFREVMEVRLGLSRMWEDIQQWAQRSEITSFYFSNSKLSLLELLKLTAMSIGAKSAELGSNQKSSTHSLFNYFSKQSSSHNSFERLISIQKQLKDWFETDDIYHLIGFCRFAKNSEYKRLSFLHECLSKPTKTALKSFLIEKKSELIFGNSSRNDDKKSLLKNLKYGDDDQQIHAVLLALSVFPKTTSRRFDFDSFKQHSWSLEHVFPQTPEGKGHRLSECEKNNVRKILNEEDKNTTEIELLLEQTERSSDEQKIYVSAMRETGVIDNIGNMCLLTGGNNSALGCMFFEGKRGKILTLIQEGHFVPKHTFDVFAKMIKGLDSDLKQWSKKDIEAHAEYVATTILEDIMDEV